jgi:DNA processing protein
VSAGLPPEAYAAALAGLDRITGARLVAVLRQCGPEAGFRVLSGDESPHPGSLVARMLGDAELRAAFVRSARRTDPAAVWDRCTELGVTVTYFGGPDHPVACAAEPSPVPVLFTLGDRTLLDDGRRVAVVGTRNASPTGRHVASSFGAGLARAGVHVVSGLARGVDGCAHRAVVDTVTGAASGSGSPAAVGRPIGVVACGLDVVYPPEHRRLWGEVAEHGVLVSEWPPGSAPVAHRFPLRNRIIAGLSDLVVVVESRETGGSLITAVQAAERGVPVMAVPGSTAARTSAGVNALLRDGVAPALDVDDVLIALSLTPIGPGPLFAEHRSRPRQEDLPAYRAVAERPATLGDISASLGFDLGRTAMALARLEHAGWITQVDGWFDLVGSPLR